MTRMISSVILICSIGSLGGFFLGVASFAVFSMKKVY